MSFALDNLLILIIRTINSMFYIIGVRIQNNTQSEKVSWNSTRGNYRDHIAEICF